MNDSGGSRGHLRLARVDDVPQLTLLLHEAYAELGAAGLNFTAVDQAKAVTTARMQPRSTWVIEHGAELLATATLTLPPSREVQQLSREAARPATAWLNQLAVSPAHRGSGLASRLFAHGTGWARSCGARRIGLDTAAPAVRLRELYERWGFVEMEMIRWPDKTYESVVMTRAV